MIKHAINPISKDKCLDKERNVLIDKGESFTRTNAGNYSVTFGSGVSASFSKSPYISEVRSSHTKLTPGQIGTQEECRCIGAGEGRIDCQGTNGDCYDNELKQLGCPLLHCLAWF